MSTDSKTETSDSKDTGEEGVRNGDGTVRLLNPNIKLLDHDILYHLSLGTQTHDLEKMFGDVKFVCVGGPQKRMENLAKYALSELREMFPADIELQKMEEYSHRYYMYKVGPVLSISHGVGVSSIQVLLHEIIKLMYYAKVKDPVFFRVGTCGGIGIKPGTVVVSTGAVDEMINPYFEMMAAGKRIQRPAILDEGLARELLDLGEPADGYELLPGRTMCAYDFYEGQGRIDGAFCQFSAAEKNEYLDKLHGAGVRNIDMESTCFAALTHMAGVRAGIVCATLLDRYKGDQVLTPKSVLKQWELRPQQIVLRYIKRRLLNEFI